MKTSQEKLMIAMQLIKAQSDLLALHYKLDCNVYSDKQMKRFDRLEEARDEAIKNLENSLCTCDNYDLVSVPPPSKTIRVKVHVKSRSRFIPKIII